MVEIIFGLLTDKAIRRGILHSVPDVIQGIETYLARHSNNPQPFRWPATTDQILEALHEGDADTYLAHKQPDTTVHDTEIDAVLQLAADWHAAQAKRGPKHAVMIARDNHTREQLNRAARAKLKDAGALPEHGTHIGGREYAPGDRVIARRNSRRHDLDNGTLATIIALDLQTGTVTLAPDRGEQRLLDSEYAAAHLQHAYALTGHGAQSATFTWIGVIGRPEDFTREWAYTALSRHRHHAAIHIIQEVPERDRQRAEYAPAQPQADPSQLRQALRAAISRTETEPLALERLRHPDPGPPAHTASDGSPVGRVPHTQGTLQGDPGPMSAGTPARSDGIELLRRSSLRAGPTTRR